MKRPAKNFPKEATPSSRKIPTGLVVLFLIFLLVGWAIWWYFSWKIRMLDYPTTTY